MKKSRDETRDTSAVGERRVGRLLKDAGPRPEMPAEALAKITEAARVSWRESVESRSGDTRGVGQPRVALWRESTARDATGDAGASEAGTGDATAEIVGTGVHPTLPGAPMRWALAASLLIVALAGWWWIQHAAPVDQPAAVVALVSGSGASLLASTGEAPSSPGGSLVVGDAVAVGETILTAEDGRVALRTGKVSVRLDRGSAAHFESAGRLVLERGAVYVDSGPRIDVERARASAITVVTALGEAREIGTQFEVRLIDEGAERRSLQVRVREGLVELATLGQKPVARAGSELRVDAAGQLTESEVEIDGEAWSWVVDAAPGLEGATHTLGEVLDWAERETRRPIRIEEPDVERLREQTVTGVGAQRPEVALHNALLSIGLYGELEDGELVVRRR